MKLYGVSEEKIRVIYEGYEETFQISERSLETGIVFSQTDFLSQKPYILFIGRLEERKNVTGIIRAFEKVKEKYTLPHTLILVGKPGYKYSLIQQKIQENTQKDWIREMGYVTEKEKWEALRNADVFVFPSLYEGFGIPLLEAQSVGVPLITSCTSSLPEVGGEGAIYVDSQNTDVLAESIYTLVSDKKLRDAIIEKGTENVRRFSWQKCADAIYSLFF